MLNLNKLTNPCTFDYILSQEIMTRHDVVLYRKLLNDLWIVFVCSNVCINVIFLVNSVYVCMYTYMYNASTKCSLVYLLKYAMQCYAVFINRQWFKRKFYMYNTCIKEKESQICQTYCTREKPECVASINTLLTTSIVYELLIVNSSKCMPRVII